MTTGDIEVPVPRPSADLDLIPQNITDSVLNQFDIKIQE